VLKGTQGGSAGSGAAHRVVGPGVVGHRWGRCRLRVL
jgi:hypothetical protein